MNPNCEHCKILFNQLIDCVEKQVNPPIYIKAGDKFCSEERFNELYELSQKGYWQKLWDAIKGR